FLLVLLRHPQRLPEAIPGPEHPQAQECSARRRGRQPQDGHRDGDGNRLREGQPRFVFLSILPILLLLPPPLDPLRAFFFLFTLFFLFPPFFSFSFFFFLRFWVLSSNGPPSLSSGPLPRFLPLPILLHPPPVSPFILSLRTRASRSCCAAFASITPRT